MRGDDERDRSGAHADCPPSEPLLSMKQEIVMAEGPRCKRRKQANPRRKNGKRTCKFFPGPCLALYCPVLYCDVM
ncbi:hypothetical protein CRUP_026218 [Coryphaenoides rupestris]|nr:hypothetical protein CRUP_026218 [Coryphaenoides rupestris]